MRRLRPSAKKSRWIGNGNVGFTKVEDGPALGDGEGGEVVDFFFVILISVRDGKGGEVPSWNRRNGRWDRHLFCGFCWNCRELRTERRTLDDILSWRKSHYDKTHSSCSLLKQVLFEYNELALQALDCGVFPSFTSWDECRKVLLSDFEEIVAVSVLAIDLVGAKEVA